MERGIYKKFEKMLKERGYKIEKELENNAGYEYVFYACKENIKIYLCDTNNTSNKFKSIDINLLEKELTKN